MPAVPPPDEVYIIARPLLETAPFDNFTVDLVADPLFDWHDECPWTYQTTIVPALVSPDDTTIVYDPVTQTHDIFTQNIALAGVYTLTMNLIRPSGAITAFSLSFDVTLVDPCIAATFTFDPAILPNPYEYVISQPKDI